MCSQNQSVPTWTSLGVTHRGHRSCRLSSLFPNWLPQVWLRAISTLFFFFHEQIPCLLNLSPKTQGYCDHVCCMEGESELVTMTIWFLQHAEQGLTRVDFSSFPTRIHLMKYVHHSGTKYRYYQDFIREKKPVSGEKLSQPYFSCPMRRPVH